MCVVRCVMVERAGRAAFVPFETPCSTCARAVFGLFRLARREAYMVGLVIVVRRVVQFFVLPIIACFGLPTKKKKPPPIPGTDGIIILVACVVQT